MNSSKAISEMLDILDLTVVLDGFELLFKTAIRLSYLIFALVKSHALENDCWSLGRDLIPRPIALLIFHLLAYKAIEQLHKQVSLWPG